MSQRISPRVFALCLFTLALASAAHAQATRTWVSGVGDDVNPCSRTAPCKTFAGAISKTAVNGEINVIDPGGFGAVTITKSITIDGHGPQSSVLASGTNGVVVNIAAGNANDPHRSVRLRNLSINGAGSSGGAGTRTGLDGIRFISGSSLFVENVHIGEFSQEGLEVAGPAGENNRMDVVMDNVTIRNCNGTGAKFAHAGATGQVTAALNNVRVHGCATGVEGTNRARIGIKEGVVTHNTNGLRLTGTNNFMNVDDTHVSYSSTTGIVSSAGNTIRVSDSFITQNGTGVSAGGGTITSLSGNTVTGNTSDGSFTGAAVPKT
jgi:hypothetical protein